MFWLLLLRLLLLLLLLLVSRVVSRICASQSDLAVIRSLIWVRPTGAIPDSGPVMVVSPLADSIFPKMTLRLPIHLLELFDLSDCCLELGIIYQLKLIDSFLDLLPARWVKFLDSLKNLLFIHLRMVVSHLLLLVHLHRVRVHVMFSSISLLESDFFFGLMFLI